MKVLIWILCLFAYGLLNAIIQGASISLGGIPTCILIGLTFWLAHTLCKKWDEHKSSTTGPDAAPTPTTQRITVCGKCGHKALDFDQCPQCGSGLKFYLYKDTTEQVSEEGQKEKICFCRKCCEKLIENSQFCRKCGAEIIKENQQ